MLESLICALKKHNIEFFMIGGSLIGAMRHKGFIPWDDDIDIGMTRSEYERFLKEVPVEFTQTHYFIQTDQSEAGYALSYAKLIDLNTHIPVPGDKDANVRQGVFIDVFPFDSQPKRKLAQVMHYYAYQYYDLYTKRLLGYGHATGKKAAAMTLLQRVLPKKSSYLTKRLRTKWMTRFQNNSRLNIVNLASPYSYGREVISSNELDLNWVKFETIKVPVSKMYDQILTRQYGDWRKLPAQSEQVSTHINNFEENE
ncbi:LicD family protein [Loigolactobacillus zhaoyuanensis]|uniref:Phosphorylcholine transferase LicD n=1 Tax=Loigolactobacillus zhaoyuanensis TaxID=2486017 RepID=A0ABW8UIL9_9LACO